MKSDNLRTLVIFQIALSLCLSISGCNGGDDNSTPANISGTWSGTVKANDDLLPIAIAIQQTDGNITGDYAMNFGGSTEGGTIEGTYLAGNADLTFRYSGYAIANATLAFSGNKASGEITSLITDDSGTVSLTKE